MSLSIFCGAQPAEPSGFDESLAPVNTHIVPPPGARLELRDFQNNVDAFRPSGPTMIRPEGPPWNAGPVLPSLLGQGRSGFAEPPAETPFEFGPFTTLAVTVIGLWLTGLLGLFVLGFALSRATLRQVERSDPTVPIAPDEQRLRRVYRVVLNVTGVYYYLSLPVVLALVILVSGGVIYAFMVMGFLPIKLLAILAFATLAIIWAMARSLFVRVKVTDPGRPLARAEAEGLWQLTEEVARTLDTRPIDEIRITVGTDLCVYERGSWRDKLQNRAKRVLVIGTAVLNGFKQADFRSVLAHEYGHFSNRDTAGGDIAMRVQNDMLKFYYAMVEAGQATWLNVSFHFLRAYNFIFRRISHGATRLQEVLADRVAAQAYGARAFEGGLRHVIRQSIVFGERADQEVDAAIKSRQPVQNLYDFSCTDASTTTQEKFEQVINAPTTADDTHPGPLDRFRLISAIPEPSRPAVEGLVWDLFADRAAIVTEMMKRVEENIALHRP